MGRMYQPCRVCGRVHENRMSSSICPQCGQKEQEVRIQAEVEEQERRSAFESWMQQTEEERWEEIFEIVQAIRLTQE